MAKKKILFIASDPPSFSRIDIQPEEYAIEGVMKQIKDYELITPKIYDFLSAITAIEKYKPAIIHYCEHCNNEGKLVFQENENLEIVENKKSIDFLLNASKKGNPDSNLEFIFFSACYSDKLAGQVSQKSEVDCIGFKGSLLNDGNLILAITYFYTYLLNSKGPNYTVSYGRLRKISELNNLDNFKFFPEKIPAHLTGDKYCASCGSPLNDSDKFCSSCGSKINFRKKFTSNSFSEIEIERENR